MKNEEDFCRQKILAQAAQQAWESICITDAELEPPGPHLIYVNSGYEALMGWSEAEVLGKNPRIHQGPLTDRKVLERLKNNLKAGECFHGEAINYRKNGESFWLEWKISPVKNESGVITHFIAFQRDVSEIKAARQRLDDFHSVLSHELRAPLTSILGALRLLDVFYTKSNTEEKQFVEIAIQSADTMMALINDLLELKKIESGRLELKIESVSAYELVQTAAENLKTYLPEQSVKIVIDATNAQVRVDRARILQVLVNLITNALKFSPPDSVVMVKAVQGENNLVRFSISDNGPGICEDDQRKLFSKFQQLAAADGNQRPGTGLGLSIAKELVTQHGGQIGCTSSLGEGSTFWFELS